MKNPVNNEKYLKEQNDKKHLSEGFSKSVILPPIAPETNKFKRFKSIQEHRIMEDIQKEEEYFAKEKEENNRKTHETERKFHFENIKADKQGQEQWESNYQRMKEFEKKQNANDNKEAIYYRNATVNAFVKSAEENRKQIDHFDKNLSRLGLDVVSIDPKLRKTVVNMTADMILQKIREKVALDAAAKKDREKRQRKIGVEQFKAQTRINYQKTVKALQHREDDAYLKTVLERRQDYEDWRYLHERDRLHDEKRTKIPLILSNFDTFVENKTFNRDDFYTKLNRENLTVRKMFSDNKKLKREKNTSLVNGVMDLILNLTEEVFLYQNTKGVDLVDIPDWRDMSQRFIDNVEFVLPEKKEYFQFEEKHEDEFIGTDLSAYPSEEIEFAVNEMFDYIYLIGQWECREKLNKNIVLKIQDVMTMENEPLGLQNPYPDYYEPSNDELEALTIPKDNLKSYIFGDILDVSLEIKYSENSQQLGKNLLAHIPIKLSLIGHAFAGKKTQAKMIADANPGVKVYNLDELIKRSIETMEKLDTPIEAHPKFKTFKKNQIDQMMNEKAQEEVKFTEIRKIITPLKDDRCNNELLINLLLEYIKIDFPQRPHEAIVEEILNKHRRRKEINEELAKIKEEQAKKPKAKVKEEQLLTNELNKLNLVSNLGFIVLDFPKNAEQARILEHKFTGYIQEIEKPTPAPTHFKEIYSLVIDKISRPPKAKAIKASGIDFVVVVNVQEKECISRATGRKLDPNTGIMYHMHDNPPPENDKRLNERLQLLECPTTEIEKFNNEFDLGFNKLGAFYDSFGYPRYGYRLLNILNADGLTRDKVNHGVVEYIQKVNKMNEDKEKDIIASCPADYGTTKLSHNPGNTLFSNKSPQANQSHTNIREHTVTSLFKEPSMKESVINLNVIRETPNQTHTSNFHVNNISHEHLHDNLSAIIQDDEENKFQKRVDEAKKKFLNVDNILNKWYSQFNTYVTELKLIFLSTKRQTKAISNNFTDIQNNYIYFLQRPSKKVAEVSKFQNKYNQFFDEYPELISDLEIREQFHQDIDDLTERIWDQIELRKTEAIEERGKIMSTGWIENEMIKFFNYFERILMAEIEKLITVLNLIFEYYLTLDGKPFPEISAVNFLKLIKPADNVPLETPSGFPRVEKIYRNCIKVIIKFDELSKSFDKVGRQNTITEASNTSVKRAKPHVRRNITEMTSLLDEKNLFLYEEEMKNAIKAEKTKFKYRITTLKQWAIGNLSNMRNLANTVYNQLDDWIIQTIKTENDAMNILINRLRDCIDHEYKVKNINEVELDTFDFYEKIEVGLAKVLTPNTDDDSFELKTFLKIFDELKMYEVQKNYIKSRSFVDIYIKRHMLEASFGISKAMREVSYHNLRALIKGFEFVYNGEEGNSEQYPNE
jgi:hypothetical protein